MTGCARPGTRTRTGFGSDAIGCYLFRDSGLADEDEIAKKWYKEKRRSKHLTTDKLSCLLLMITQIHTRLLFSAPCLAVLQQQFRNLHGVQRGAFFDLVAAHEQLQPEVPLLRDVAPVCKKINVSLVWAISRRNVVSGKDSPDAPDEHVVLVRGVQGGGELVVLPVVDDGYARGFA